MKERFCEYQLEMLSDDHSRNYFECTLYNKECPYRKKNKAEKKCSMMISEREEDNG